MRDLGDTIAAIATAPGEGGVAIVRVSGPEAKKVGGTLLGGRTLEPRRATVGWVRRPSDRQGIDEVLALWMPGPNSYTRQDVLELQCHGGQAAARAVLGLTLEAGARLAEPGEFTLRAYLGGRLDLVQAEAVLDTIRAQTEEVLAVQENLLAGALSDEVGRWQEALGEVLARLEASLDFPEEELGDLDEREVCRVLGAVHRAMEAKLGTYAWGRVAREGFRVALVGSPNVGKSSLLNALAQGDHAIVSPVPGTTRDSIEVALNACGAPLRLVDTAGLRSEGDEVEQEGVRRARRMAAAADLVLFLCDGGRDLTEEEGHEAGRLASAGRVVGVVTKSDLGAAPEAELSALLGRPPLRVSAHRDEGLEELLRFLRDSAWGGGGPTGAGVLTRERHRQGVSGARAAVGRALAHLGDGVYGEVVAAEVQAARRELAELLGRGSSEDVLDRIFGEFCIGK